MLKHRNFFPKLMLTFIRNPHQFSKMSNQFLHKKNSSISSLQFRNLCFLSQYQIASKEKEGIKPTDHIKPNGPIIPNDPIMPNNTSPSTNPINPIDPNNSQKTPKEPLNEDDKNDSKNSNEVKNKQRKEQKEEDKNQQRNEQKEKQNGKLCCFSFFIIIFF